MSAYSHQGHVYFAACGQYVKIGYTTQTPIEKRLKSLPGKVRVPADFDPADTIWMLHAIPGCIIRDERRIHGLFAQYQVEGEWFRMSPAFLQHLEALRYVTYREERLRFRRARAELKRSPSRFYALTDLAALADTG